jgi:hypothetical protein
MNDDDLIILASAYLDGDVTADERAQVEASSELLAEVDRLRTVRAVISTTSSADAAPISARERHLSTALAAWDRLPDNERTGALRDSTPSGANRAAAAGVAAMSSPTRRTAKRRWGQSPIWLGAAAAGLVVVLAGGLLLRDTVDDGSTDAELSSAESSAELSSNEFDATQSRASDTGAPSQAADVGDDAATEPQLDEAAAAGAPSPAPVGTVDTDLDAEAPPSDDGALVQLNSVEDLALFASDAVGAPASADMPDDATVITDVPADVLAEAQEALDELDLPLCLGADVVVGVAIYIDERVVVGIDERNNRAVAYREDDCSLVARASLS